MFKPFNNLKLQARLILMISPALLVGALLAGSALWIINLLDNEAHQLIIDVRDTAEANHAQIAATRLELAATNYLMIEKEDFFEEQERMIDEVTNYFNRLTTYNQKLWDDGFDLEMDEEITAIGEQIAAYNSEWQHVAEADSINGTALDHGYAAIAASEQLQQAIDSVYTGMLDYQISRSDTIEQYDTIFRYAGYIGIGLFIALLILTIVMFNAQVALPLAQMQTAAEQFARDEFDPASIQALTERKDEIGNLARAFLQMVEDVQSQEQVFKDQAVDFRTKIKNLTKN